MTDERKDQLTAEADGLIEGRNAVIEALRTEASIDKIFIQKGEVDKTLGHIASKARAAGIVVVEADRRKLDNMSRTHAHQGVIALAAIVLLAIMISYLVVRRPNFINHSIDTISMMPYIMPGSVIAIALVIGFGKKPLVLTGTLAIMIIAVIIRRLPYTTRSATATLIQIPLSVEEASISLGASKMKTFFKVTVPMMSSGIISGAILSWVSIVTEVSSAAILYNNRSITLTVGTYAAVSRGNFGEAAAFAAVTTVLTALSLFLYMRLNRGKEIQL